MSRRIAEAKFPLSVHLSREIKLQGEREYYPSVVMKIVLLITYVMAMTPDTRMLVE